MSADACKHRIPKEAENGKSAVFARIRHRTGVTFSARVIHPLHPGHASTGLMRGRMGQKFPWEKRSHGKEIPNLFLYGGGSDSQESGGTFTRPGMGIPGSGSQAFMPCGLLDKVSRCAMIEGMGDMGMS